MQTAPIAGANMRDGAADERHARRDTQRRTAQSTGSMAQSENVEYCGSPSSLSVTPSGARTSCAWASQGRCETDSKGKNEEMTRCHAAS